MERERHTKNNLPPDIPNDFRLMPDETFESFEHNKKRNGQIQSTADQLVRLTYAHDFESINNSETILAALSLKNSDIEDPRGTPEHLRLYEAFFGRDSLQVANTLIYEFPKLAEKIILRLAANLGTEDNTEREEEMGRVPHEIRSDTDPVAHKLTMERGWGWPYYGSVDATPKFIRTIAKYCRMTEENCAFLSKKYIDKNNQEQTMLHALEMSLAWIERRMNSNPEGLIEYKTVLERGIENQVWKDSPDAYHHANGMIANHNKGISALEVQTLSYDALIDAAELYEDTLDQQERANELRSKANNLKEVILEKFWTEDKGGYFVIGLDRDDRTSELRQMKIRTSNMGHALNSRLLEGEDAESIRKRQLTISHLLSPEMLNVSGIRTLADDEFRFRPDAYHNGSVWPWDTHFIAEGIRKFGYTKEADMLDDRLLNIHDTLVSYPEYVRGDHGDKPSINDYTITVRYIHNG